MREQMFKDKPKSQSMRGSRFPRAAKRYAWSIVAMLMIGSPASAQDAELWLYPCDYSLGSACIRLPNFMEISYEVPADFGLHIVSSKAGMSLTMYEGDAHSLGSSATSPSISFSDGGRTVSGYLSSPGEGQEVVDVVVLSANSRMGAIHIHADVADENKRADVAKVLSGFRLCKFRKTSRSSTTVCPRESAMGERLAAWLKEHKSGG